MAIYSGFSHKKIVISHTYVSLPEGSWLKKIYSLIWDFAKGLLDGLPGWNIAKHVFFNWFFGEVQDSEWIPSVCRLHIFGTLKSRGSTRNTMEFRILGGLLIPWTKHLVWLVVSSMRIIGDHHLISMVEIEHIWSHQADEHMPSVYPQCGWFYISQTALYTYI